MLAEFYRVPGPWTGELGILPRPRGGDWIEEEMRSWRRAGIDVVVSLLTPGEERELDLEREARLGRQHGLEFHALPIPDRSVPESRAEVTRLVRALQDALREGKKVAIHCRQGIGRSSLLAAALLVAGGVGAKQAFRVIEQVRSTPVPETPAQRQWVEDFAKAAAA